MKKPVIVLVSLVMLFVASSALAREVTPTSIEDVAGATTSEVSAYYSDGQVPELAVVVVPEPSSLALLGIGGVLALVRRRR